MRIIESVTVTPAMMISSSVPENDYPAWSSATTYGLGDRVIHDHAIWESVQPANHNHDPTTDTTNAWWIKFSATNRWRAFDGQLQPPTSYAGDITYTIALNADIDSVAMFGLVGATARIQVERPVWSPADIFPNAGFWAGPFSNAPATSVIDYDQTTQLAGDRIINGWWDYFFAPFSIQPSLVQNDIPGFLGSKLTVTISGSGTQSVGEIIIGVNTRLGDTLVDTALGFRDFSVKERNEWGAWQVVKRGYSKTVEYRFSLTRDDVGRVYRAITRNRARMCVFSAGPGTDNLETTVLGFINEDGLQIPITAQICFATLSVESLTEDE